MPPVKTALASSTSVLGAAAPWGPSMASLVKTKAKRTAKAAPDRSVAIAMPHQRRVVKNLRNSARTAAVIVAAPRRWTGGPAGRWAVAGQVAGRVSDRAAGRVSDRAADRPAERA